MRALQLLIALSLFFPVDTRSIQMSQPALPSWSMEALVAPLLISSHASVLRPSTQSTLDRQAETFRRDAEMSTASSRAIIRLALVSAMLTPLALIAQTPPSAAVVIQPKLSGWLTYFKPEANWVALARYGERFSQYNVFAVSADAKGHLNQHQDFVKDAVGRLQKLSSKPTVSVVVTNDRLRHEKDSRLIHQWLSTPGARQAHIDELMALAQTADGLTLDYENINQAQGAGGVLGKLKKVLRRPSTRDDGPLYTQFVHDLAAALHAQGKQLVVTLEDKTRNGAHPLDYAALAGDADMLEIMAYHYHGPGTKQGAISPADRVKELTGSALHHSHVPADKLRIILPLFGFDWAENRTRGVTLIGTVDRLQELAKTNQATIERDVETHSALLRYWITRPIFRKKKVVRSIEEHHFVWFEDGASIVFKMKMLATMGVSNVGLWQLATGDIDALFDPIPTLLLTPSAPVIDTPTSPAPSNRLELKGAA